jgi:hypothetical protein
VGACARRDGRWIDLVQIWRTDRGRPFGKIPSRPIFQQAAELFSRGMTVREVKATLGVSHGKAGRLRLRAAAEGLLEPGREDEEEEAEMAVEEDCRLN